MLASRTRPEINGVQSTHQINYQAWPAFQVQDQFLFDVRGTLLDYRADDDKRRTTFGIPGTNVITVIAQYFKKRRDVPISR